MSKYKVTACVDGEAIDLTKVSDPIFARKLTGDGMAIRPSSNHFYSPADGTVRMFVGGLHAFVIENDDGAFILVHIGTNTLSLNGEGFEAHVKQGDKVKCGDLIISVDEELMNNPKYDLTTVILIMKQKFEQQVVERKIVGRVYAKKTTVLKVSIDN